MRLRLALPTENIRGANDQCPSAPHHPRPRNQFLSLRWRQHIDLELHRQHRRICRRQRKRRITASSIRNRRRHSSMKITVLLRQIFAITHANLRHPRLHVHQSSPQIPHQPLLRKTLAHSFAIFRIQSDMRCHAAKYSHRATRLQSPRAHRPKTRIQQRRRPPQ